MKKFKTLNNAYCWDIIRLACQSKWRFVAFALYNHESHFTDNLKSKIWSVLCCCSNDCVTNDIKSSLTREEYSLMCSSFNRYILCFIND